MSRLNYIYPFTAIVGQDDMKTALILNIINPLLGGVLIRGEKGTAKSTAVRSLADLLPIRNQVEECIYACDPKEQANMCGNCIEKKVNGSVTSLEKKMRVINLPVSATEDRVVGTLDIEHALKNGEKKFEPGILALANRNILYVDEVNLLDDHVVDVLLDAAAMGVNTIEREGISYTHPSRFVLVGTMNPEEGDLRPQLIDRFGLVVDVTSEHDLDKRVEVIKSRLVFEKNPEELIAKYKEKQAKLADKIIKAKEKLNQVKCSDNLFKIAAQIAINLDVDGHRADITMIKTACTYAAFCGRDEVEKEDMFLAARLALPHRMRRTPFEEGTLDIDEIYDDINTLVNKEV